VGLCPQANGIPLKRERLCDAMVGERPNHGHVTMR
jgi:hypothetical protein